MLIKIAKAPYFEGSQNNSFTLIDKVDSIDFCRTQPIEVDNNDELRQSLYTKGIYAHGLPEVFIEELNIDRIATFIGYNSALVCGGTTPIEQKLSEHCVYRFNTIQFTRLGKIYYATFDTIAYICNDEGKTLEKCFAGGVLNK